jgi:BirA family biotin operon repressor/biotin-[acetyl-CoA-carboxylase] ligase
MSDDLDADAIRTAIDADARGAFAAIDVVDIIDSTNSELLRRRTPDTGLAALFAERQDGGRGRHGRAWASPPGANLYLSLARTFAGDVARLGGLSLVVGVAVAEALHALGATEVDLKWPNDLVVDDAQGGLRKLGGILIEGGLQDGRPRAVIGLGLNVRMPADAAAAIDQPWTDLQALLGARTPSRNVVAATLLSRLASALRLFDAEGLRPFLPRFEVRDALRDMQVTARIGEREVVGIASGLDDDGALVLRTREGPLRLHAGEVSVRRHAAPST